MSRMTQQAQKFKQLIPLFTDLGESIYQNLDLSGFFLPLDEVGKLRQELENRLGHYVVSYKSDIFNLKVKAEEHLCAIVKGAKLNTKQLEVLKKYESMAALLGVTFVVYQKPLKLREIKDSALYKEYLKRGLL